MLGNSQATLLDPPTIVHTPKANKRDQHFEASFINHQNNPQLSLKPDKTIDQNLIQVTYKPSWEYT